MWIDAICIDQDNILEQSHQVAMMGQVYRSASLVRAWLGVERDGSKEACRELHRLKTGQHYTPNKCTAPRAAVALDLLLNRSYWTRAWVVQEIMLAQKLSLHCGGDGISWWPDIYATLSKVGLSCSPMAQIFLLKMNGQVSLWSLMRNCYTAEATNFRDRVYAFLGIASDVPPNTLPVDYNVSLKDLNKQLNELYGCKTTTALDSWWDSWVSRSDRRQHRVDDLNLRFPQYLDLTSKILNFLEESKNSH